MLNDPFEGTVDRSTIDKVVFSPVSPEAQKVGVRHLPRLFVYGRGVASQVAGT